MATRLDRLARSTRDLLDLAESLNRAGAGLRSLAEPWADTTSPAGKRVLTVFAGIAEFERALIAERTHRPARRARKGRAFRPSAGVERRAGRARAAPPRRRHLGARGRPRPALSPRHVVSRSPRPVRQAPENHAGSVPKNSADTNFGDSLTATLKNDSGIATDDTTEVFLSGGGG